MPRCNHIPKVLKGFLVVLFFFLAMFGAFTDSVRACQETFFEFQISGNRVRLLSYDGEPVAHGKVIVREAFGSAQKKTRWGTPVGKVVLRGKTDGDGYFSLKDLQGEHYWLTYDDPEAGESFLLSPVQDSDKKTLELKLNDFKNRCYLFDIEHNVTKPRSWHPPIGGSETQIVQTDGIVIYSTGEPLKQKSRDSSSVKFQVPAAQELSGVLKDPYGGAIGNLKLELMCEGSTKLTQTDFYGKFNLGLGATWRMHDHVRSGAVARPNCKMLIRIVHCGSDTYFQTRR